MSKKIFLGIGAGPIQTGIFVAGAAAGGFERIVLADVDSALVEALRRREEAAGGQSAGAVGPSAGADAGEAR